MWYNIQRHYFIINKQTFKINSKQKSTSYTHHTIVSAYVITLISKWTEKYDSSSEENEK